jgi:hypothetical protein
VAFNKALFSLKRRTASTFAVSIRDWLNWGVPVLPRPRLNSCVVTPKKPRLRCQRAIATATTKADTCYHSFESSTFGPIEVLSGSNRPSFIDIGGSGLFSTLQKVNVVLMPILKGKFDPKRLNAVNLAIQLCADEWQEMSDDARQLMIDKAQYALDAMKRDGTIE